MPSLFGDDDLIHEPIVRRLGPMSRLAIAWTIGCALGWWLDRPMLWLLLAALGVCVAGFLSLKHRPLSAIAWGLIVASCLGAARMNVYQHVPANHISRHLVSPSSLAEIIGTIDGPPRPAPPPKGAMAQAHHEGQATMLALRVEQLIGDNGPREVSGRLLVKLMRSEHRLRDGDRVRLIGWMRPIEGPSNPGEPDFRVILQQRGYDGRFTVPQREHVKVLDPAPPWWTFEETRWALADAAVHSLNVDLRQEGDAAQQRVAVLETMLLGRWSDAMGDLNDAFRRVGLIHILCISGAHLGILAALLWFALRFTGLHPRMVAIVSLTVIGLYLLAVPWSVPVIRAGIAAGLVGLAVISGRRAPAIELLGVATTLSLLWRPIDLLDPGFQLSFGTSAALILCTRPLSLRLYPSPLTSQDAPDGWMLLKRAGADYLAANLVGFYVTLPMVTYHYSMFSPVALALGLIALPAVSLLLWLGLAKIAIGLVLPSAGLLLARPVELLTDVINASVRIVASWRMSAVTLSEAPSAWWAGLTVGLAICWAAGLFRARRWLLVSCIAGSTFWGLGQVVTDPLRQATQRAGFASTQAALSSDSPALHVHALSVGDGSCFVLRWPVHDATSERDWITWVFDCGSQQYADVGLRSVEPALRSLGASHIDTLVLSHADWDHIVGAPDVARKMEVRRLLISPQMAQQTGEQPASVPAMVLSELEKLRVPREVISQGWSERVGEVIIEALWPPADFSAPRNNDVSLVLRFTTAGKSVLLQGDIQELAITQLLKSGVMGPAEVADLPHHGSFVDSSPRWLAHLNPSIVLQSTGAARLRNDKWEGVFARTPRVRLITAHSGMVTVKITRDGTLTSETFIRR